MKTKFEEIKEIIDSDKRLCDRLRLPLQVYYSEGLIENKDELVGPVELDNASGKGLMFYSDVEMAKGRKINVRLFIENDPKPIDFDGEIMWFRKNDLSGQSEKEQKGRGYLYGVFIVEKDETDYERFVAYIADNILDEYLDENGKIREE
jgi:hypothetical protein